MAILSFLVQLAGATMLLLFAVRMVRTGIERSYGASFQRILTGQSGLAYSGAAGVVLAGVLQSSAAVALLVAGFASNGLITFANGLALVLGGDLGSALIIQVLTFRLDWLVPLLLTAGGWLFVKVTARKWRQMGRILMGIAFILISLRFLRETMDPIRDSAFLPAIANYLAQDYLTAFFVGATLAFVMHSSVAAILMCVTLVQIGAIPFSAGLSLVLGANLGSAFIPIWLTRGMPNAARRIPFANLATRGTWALMALFAVNLLPAGNILTDRGSGQMLVYAHVVFNASLLLLLLPFCRPLEPVFRRFLPDAPANSGVQTGPDMLRSLDPNAIGSPQQAIADLKRELLRMMDQVELMFRPVIALYRTWDKDQVKTIETMDQRVNQSLSDIRNFVAAIPQKSFTKDQARAARDMMEYAIRLEAAGDIVTLRFAPLAGNLNKLGVALSKEGMGELVRMHECILANLKLASNVLISDDLESARLLSLEKTEIKRAERDSRKRHLKRLQNGTAQSIETSDIHLETLRALREFNSHISAVAYPILYTNGQLLETRLIETMPDRDDT